MLLTLRQQLFGLLAERAKKIRNDAVAPANENHFSLFRCMQVRRQVGGLIAAITRINWQFCCLRKRLDRQIAAVEEFLSSHDLGHELYAQKSEELKIAQRKRAEILLEDASKRVERNPTDLQLRFELGEHLANAGHFRQALPELQRARQNPNARLKAMNLLGRCYRELGMLDLAMKQLEEASKEILSMDAMKKEIVYNLGLVYEQMGEREKSLNCMKQIYEVDYGYKDVATRVESSYQ